MKNRKRLPLERTCVYILPVWQRCIVLTLRKKRKVFFCFHVFLAVHVVSGCAAHIVYTVDYFFDVLG